MSLGICSPREGVILKANLGRAIVTNGNSADLHGLFPNYFGHTYLPKILESHVTLRDNDVKDGNVNE